MQVYRCSWSLGVPTKQLQRWGLPLLTQPCARHRGHSPRLGTCSQLHTTRAVLQSPAQHQQHSLSRQQLSWQDLHRAAQIAAWSGLCYLMPDELQSTITKQHQGLTLVASGRNGYTAWFVADGVVPAAHFCSTISSRNSSSTATTANTNSSTTNSSTTKSSAISAPQAAGAGTSEGGVCAGVPQGTRERFVFFRGVQWSAPDINNPQLSQALMSLWPTRFPAGVTSSNGGSSGNNGGNSGSNGSSNGNNGSSPLVAHAGVAGIAQELFSQLRPYMQQADDVGMPLCFAGHSLGGSLAMLMLVLHQTSRRNRQQRPWPSCYTFGSPPVLAHEKGGGGPPVLSALGLPPDSISSFVLEMDPVPRALLSVDPTFQAIAGWSAVKGLLQLRELFVGSGSPLSPGRFLFEAVGQVHLIKWTPEGGSRVVPLDATEIEQELSLLAPKPPGSNGSRGSSLTAAGEAAAAAAAATPGAQLQQQAQEASGLASAPAAAAGGAAAAIMNSMRAWLDHHHRSYAQELEAAALRGVREQLAAEQQQERQRQAAVAAPGPQSKGVQGQAWREPQQEAAVMQQQQPGQQQQQDVVPEVHRA